MAAHRLRTMDPFAQHLLTRAYNIAWANYRLLGACMALSAGEFEAPRTGFFPSIKATLNHNLTVDRYYLDAIERSRNREPVNPDFLDFFAPGQPFDTCAALQVAQTVSDRRLIAVCQALDAAGMASKVEVPRRAGVHIEPVVRLLAHLFQHQTHHRGQAHGMLSATRVTPPQLDEFFCANEAALRVADFTALGFSEAAIWPRAE